MYRAVLKKGRCEKRGEDVAFEVNAREREGKESSANDVVVKLLILPSTLPSNTQESRCAYYILVSTIMGNCVCVRVFACVCVFSLTSYCGGTAAAATEEDGRKKGCRSRIRARKKAKRKYCASDREGAAASTSSLSVSVRSRWLW